MVAGRWANVKNQVRVRLDVSSKTATSERTGRFSKNESGDKRRWPSVQVRNGLGTQTRRPPKKGMCSRNEDPRSKAIHCYHCLIAAPAYANRNLRNPVSLSDTYCCDTSCRSYHSEDLDRTASPEHHLQRAMLLWPRVRSRRSIHIYNSAL